MARFLTNRKATSGRSPGTLIHIGSKKIEKPRLRLFNYDPEDFTETELEYSEDVLKHINEKSVTWFNIDGLHDADLIEKVGTLFNIHSLSLEDILNTDQRPKITESEDQAIIILKNLQYDQTLGKIQTEQMSIILCDNFVLTFQERVGDYFNPIRERIRNNKGKVRIKKADYLVYLLLDAIVDNYLIIIESLGEAIEATESKIFKDISDGIIEEIYNHKTEINYLRKTIRPVKEVANYLMKNESGFIDDHNLKYFNDLNDLVIQASEAVEVYQSMVTDQLNIYHTNLNNKSNEIMKVLTIFAAFFIPLTFIAGIYGTNFDYLPELHLRYGYLYFWIVILLLATGLFFYFRRKKWF